MFLLEIEILCVGCCLIHAVIFYFRKYILLLAKRIRIQHNQKHHLCPNSFLHELESSSESYKYTTARLYLMSICVMMMFLALVLLLPREILFQRSKNDILYFCVIFFSACFLMFKIRQASFWEKVTLIITVLITAVLFCLEILCKGTAPPLNYVGGIIFLWLLNTHMKIKRFLLAKRRKTGTQGTVLCVDEETAR